MNGASALRPGPPMAMPHLLRHFRRVHLHVFLGCYLAFAGLTWLVLHAGSESDRRERRMVAATLGTVTGPFTGVIARHGQACCWRFSVAVFPWCALFLAVGVLFQVMPLPVRRWERAVRLTLWCIGLLGWFGGALVSFLHALS